MAAKRAMGGVNFPPILTGIVDIAGNVDVTDLIKTLTSCDADVETTMSAGGVIHLTFPKLKKRFSFFVIDARDLTGVLDAAKVCNSLIFVASLQGFDVQVFLLYNF